jgi:hypothetical protein
VIGIFDSGVGGTTVAKAVEQFLPDKRLVYFGDLARTPYGSKSPETIRKYAKQNTEFLLGHGAKIIIVACNSAASVASDLLKEQFNVATLSRGYKRKTRGFILASKNSKVEDIGDEPKQMKQKYPDIEVAVDANRVRGINKLLSEEVETDIRVVLLDDAFQHRYVKPGYSILLVDYNRPITKDHLLPVGRLREQAYEKRRANRNKNKRNFLRKLFLGFLFLGSF